MYGLVHTQFLLFSNTLLCTRNFCELVILCVMLLCPNNLVHCYRNVCKTQWTPNKPKPTNPSLVTNLEINLCICQHAFKFLPDTVSDKNSWDTLMKRCFFPSRAPLAPLKVIYHGSVTKSCTPTLRGQEDPKVSQPS